MISSQLSPPLRLEVEKFSKKDMIVVAGQFPSSCARVDLEMTDQRGDSPKIVQSKLTYLIHAVNFASDIDICRMRSWLFATSCKSAICKSSSPSSGSDTILTVLPSSRIVLEYLVLTECMNARNLRDSEADVLNNSSSEES